MEMNWEDFEAECKGCTACDLASTRTNVVIYRGNRTAPLMIVGEAPGENEDLKGLPFVGRSGQLLQFLLNSYGLTENDYHICNICKCRPPENRRPTKDEVRSCKNLLAKQFSLVKPKIVLLCGATAYEAFFNTKPKMNEVRGQFIEKGGYLVMTTYHPAFALRNPKMRVPMMEDLGVVCNKLVEFGKIKPIEKINE